MNIKQKMMLAMVGAAIAAAYSASAASNLSYSDGDLILSFRDSADGVNQEGDDVTIDEGNITTFLSTVAALPSVTLPQIGTGNTAVFDTGSGYSTTTFSTQFTGSSLINKVTGGTDSFTGDASIMGFSAAAESLPGSTLYLTRQIAGSQLATGGTPNNQETINGQINTANVIATIGQGAMATPTGTGGTFSTTAPNGAGAQGDGNANSYHSLIADNTGAISYQTYQSPSNPSAIEATPASGTVYEALWEVPVSGSDTYEGYFTWQADGELSFTEASAVPEPSTYAMLLGGASVIALAMRRKYIALHA